jgi:hypothetical protein
MPRLLWAAVFVVAVVLVISALSVNIQPLSRDQAVAFVLDDVAPLSTQGVSARVVDVRAGDQNRFDVDVLLTKNAHTACPFVEKRFYSLLPVGFRSEPLVSSCASPVSIHYREEALIASSSFAPVPSQGYGCGFFLGSFDATAAAIYCDGFSEQDFEAFSSGLNRNVWVVSWTFQGGTSYIALSPQAELLKNA